MPTANTIETLAARFVSASPLRFTLSSPDLSRPFYSPAHHHHPPLLSAKVETVKGWREQAKAERDAGIEGGGQHQYTILIQFFKCDLCRICIGRDYYEQELYLYPVYHQKERISDDPTYYDEPRFLHICGGCAARRCLPSPLRMIEPSHWLTTVLLVEEGEPVRDANPESTIEKFRIRKALREHIERYHQHYDPLKLWHALQKGEPVATLPERRREQTARKAGGKNQAGSLLYFTSPLATAIASQKTKPVSQEPTTRKENVV